MTRLVGYNGQLKLFHSMLARGIIVNHMTLFFLSILDKNIKPVVSEFLVIC